MFAVSCIGVAFLVVALEFMRRVGKEYDAAMVRKFQQHATYRGLDSKPQTEARSPTVLVFRATPFQQVVRSIIHMVQFAVAYLIMLLAMYFNGYIIISIIIGAFLGKFLCDWGPLKVVVEDPSVAEDSQMEDLTVCCG
jgi:solute carrier family 31 (copper transporter), member 1